MYDFVRLWGHAVRRAARDFSTVILKPHVHADLRRVRSAGADAALVGEALMRASDPAALLAEWSEVLAT